MLAGETFGVDVGSGGRVLVLCAHHDAVPGSPGANDNAAAVGILLALLERISPAVPAGLRVRFLFTACEELDYLGAREYVGTVGVEGVAGVLSLELCGIGDSLVVWHAVEETAFTPFDTYHTPRDTIETLEPRALELTARAVESVIAAMG